MICPARDLVKLAGRNPFSEQPSNPTLTRFVSIAAKRLRTRLPTPLSLPAHDDWLLRVIVIEDRFVLGVYRREMKAISYLAKLEKQIGVPLTTRNWNTIERVLKILEQS
jgi:uncharacterized protein (DUF1697 family)